MELNIENKQEENLDKDFKQNIEKGIDNNVTEEKQNSFLQSTLGKTINTAFDLGLRAVLPELVEDQVIDIKNTVINCGFQEGINSAIKSAIELGKSAIGIFSGKFENLSQVHTAIKKGGIIDSVSNVINNVINQASKNNLISKGTTRFIKKGKNAILDTISANIEDKFLEELRSLEKVSKYIENWKNSYNNKDLIGMEREYNKLKKQIDSITPLQSTINEAKKIENVHILLKNKGKNYELSEVEQELTNKLV